MQAPKTDAQEAKLSEWKKKWEDAKSEFSPYYARFDKQEMLYDGSSHIFANRANGKPSQVNSTMVRNMVWELIESEVDCTIPAAR